jgi:hypothetical protein
VTTAKFIGSPKNKNLCFSISLSLSLSFQSTHSLSACTKFRALFFWLLCFSYFLFVCCTCKMEANVYIAAILQLAGGIIMISMELAPSGNVHSLVSSHEHHHHQESLQLHSLDSSDYDKESIGSNSKSSPACFFRPDHTTSNRPRRFFTIQHLGTFA